MGGGDVGLDEMHVFVDHLQAGVAKQVFEDVGIAAIAQEFGGKCVAEAMWVGGARDAGALADALEVAA